jgi:hypothetical protein
MPDLHDHPTLGQEYATVAQLALVGTTLDAVGKNVAALKDTVEGSVVGYERKPGLIDVVGEIKSQIDFVKKLGYAILTVAASNATVAFVRELPHLIAAFWH